MHDYCTIISVKKGHFGVLRALGAASQVSENA
jgi:hypothetical protein